MSISPTRMEPTFAGQETLANQLQKQLITEVRKVFSGKIYVEVSRYGFFENKNGNENRTKYNFYKDADIVEMRIYDLMEKFRTMETTAGIAAYINELNSIAGKK